MFYWDAGEKNKNRECRKIVLRICVKLTNKSKKKKKTKKKKERKKRREYKNMLKLHEWMLFENKSKIFFGKKKKLATNVWIIGKVKLTVSFFFCE